MDRIAESWTITVLYWTVPGKSLEITWETGWSSMSWKAKPGLTVITTQRLDFCQMKKTSATKRPKKEEIEKLKLKTILSRVTSETRTLMCREYFSASTYLCAMPSRPTPDSLKTTEVTTCYFLRKTCASSSWLVSLARLDRRVIPSS
jgi:hypothetical protein